MDFPEKLKKFFTRKVNFDLSSLVDGLDFTTNSFVDIGNGLIYGDSGQFKVYCKNQPFNIVATFSSFLPNSEKSKLGNLHYLKIDFTKIYTLLIAKF